MKSVHVIPVMYISCNTILFQYKEASVMWWDITDLLKMIMDQTEVKT